MVLPTQSGPPVSWNPDRLYAIKIRDLSVTFVALREPRFVSVLELLDPELFGLIDATSIEGLSCDELSGGADLNKMTETSVATTKAVFFIRLVSAKTLTICLTAAQVLSKKKAGSSGMSCGSPYGKLRPGLSQTTSMLTPVSFERASTAVPGR